MRHNRNAETQRTRPTRVSPLALLGLGLAALALRPQMSGLAPLLPSIQHDLRISHATAGLLVTIPILCMGAFAPAAPHVAGRIGVRAALALCIGGIGFFGLLRAGAPGTLAILLTTVPVGIGIGIAGAIVPIAVEERVGERPVLSSGVFAIGLNIGAAASAAGAVPLSHALGGWRGSLAGMSVFGAALVVPWLLLVPSRPRRIAGERLPPLPLRRALAWGLVAFYGLDALVFFGLTAWLASVYVERGWTPAEAGRLLAAFQIASIPGTALVSAVADRFGSRRQYLVGGSALLAVGTAGLVVAPDLGYLWAVWCGAAVGAVAPLLFALPLDLASDSRDVGALAAMMFLGGSMIAATAPTILGRVRDVTGSFTAPLWILVACSILLALVGYGLARQPVRARVTVEGNPSASPIS